MSFMIVDVESDRPIPAEFSMVCSGAVRFDEHLDKSRFPAPSLIGLSLKRRPLVAFHANNTLALPGFQPFEFGTPA